MVHKSGPLLTKFFKEFVHELRTPLSVISNELYILKMSGADSGQASPKTKEINETLLKYNDLISFAGAPETVDVFDLFKEVSATVNVLLALENDSEPLSWKIHKQSTQKALITLINLICEENENKLDIKINFPTSTVMLILPNESFDTTPNYGAPINLSSIYKGDKASPGLLALLDLVFFYNYLTLQISDEKILKIRQDLPS